MPKLLHQLPAYRRHRASGQARVTLNGRTFYLGPWNSAASKREYNRLTSQWAATGGTLADSDKFGELTIDELLAAFWRHAKGHYVTIEGKRATEQLNYRTLIKRFRESFGDTLAGEFGPLKLKAFRQMLVDLKLCRNVINRSVLRIKHIFAWGVENELVRSTIYDALRCVAGLRYGKTTAEESEPVKPVPDAFVDAVLPHVAPQVKAMIELQRVTGMRSGEVCQMRGADIATGGTVWTFTPARHKTMYRGHSRVVYLGPQAQEILRPWLRTDLESYLFSPAEAEAHRRHQQHLARKTPATYGNRPGTNRKSKPRKSAGDAYTTSSYLRAVKYGIDRCNKARCKQELTAIPSWHPHQLRHNAATYFRKQHGLEIARVLLGHKHATMTELYAEADTARAVEVVARIG